MQLRRSSLAMWAVILTGCNPMYIAGPAPLAIFHQQKDIALSLNGGPHGAAASAGIAVTDFLALRVSGGYRPWSEGENGFAMGGVTGYLSLGRDGFRTGPERNVRGFRGAFSIDAGAGSGVGNSRGFNLLSSVGTTFNRFSGTYFRGQIQADAGYEWPLFMLLGTLRGSLYSIRPVTVGYVEPSFCFRAGPEYLRFELQVGLSIPVTGNSDAIGGLQPLFISAGIVGLIESDPKPAPVQLEPAPQQQFPDEAPGPPPPPPEDLPPPPPPPPI